MKVVIVGGVAGGATAAARIRRLDEHAQIVVFERSGYISYANCGLPYYIGDVIEDKSQLTLQTPESFKARFNIDMKVRHEVISINREDKKVVVKNLDTDEVFEEAYDKLLLSPGAKPVYPEISGMDMESVFTLRTVEDTFAIKEYIDKNNPKSVVLAGGGYVSLELAENLYKLGMDVTIVQSSKQLMKSFDKDMVAFIHSEMRKHGVKLVLGHAVYGFRRGSDGIDVLLQDDNGGYQDNGLHADMAVFAIGVTPESKLAKEASLELGIKGSILVNDMMQTSDENIYAVGDAIQVKNSVTGEDGLISLAGPANKQGRIAADNICGGNSHYKGAMGTSILKIFDITAASSGINEQTAKDLGYDVDKVILSPMSHASYYPGGKVMTMKVLFDKKTYKLLGAQIIGYDGVDKRIDVIATAIYARMKAYELKDIDLAYAPPYSSAKDPVNMVGYMIDNIKEGVMKQFYIEDIEGLQMNDNVTLLDTRTVREYSKGHIDGFMNIPVDELRDRYEEIPLDKPIYVMCQSGLRSYISARILEGYGFECYNFTGGFRYYDAIKREYSQSREATACGIDI